MSIDIEKKGMVLCDGVLEVFHTLPSETNQWCMEGDTRK